MALKLADDVRKMIRDEIKAALEEQQFMNALSPFFVGEVVARSGIFSGSQFQSAVKQLITNQMNKY